MTSDTNPDTLQPKLDVPTIDDGGDQTPNDKILNLTIDDQTPNEKILNLSIDDESDQTSSNDPVLHSTEKSVYRQRTESTIQLTSQSTNQQTLNKAGWLNNIFGCIVPILNSIRFSKPVQSTVDDWVIPYESIHDLKFVNAGSQGSVYKAILNNRTIAVKQFRSQTNTDFIQNLKKLKHHNIVRFIGVCTSPVCLLMEYCEYGNLTELLKKRKHELEPELVWEFAFQISKSISRMMFLFLWSSSTNSC